MIPMMRSEMMLITSPNNQNLEEVRKAFNKKPTIGSWGVASPAHLVGLDISQIFNNTSPVHIPYKDYSQWFIDTSSGEVTLGFATMASAGKLEQAGKLRFIAITGNKRDSNYPNVPLISELVGKSVVDISPWVAFYVNKQVPLLIQKQLVDDIIEATKSTPVLETLSALTYYSWNINQIEFKEYFFNQRALYKKLISKYKISIN
jgi:tripartite-type tricarboxylate transporter receptor subunit TctC